MGHPTWLQVRVPRFICVDPDGEMPLFQQRHERVDVPKN
ncbi:hypothetical protein EBESD8_15850 [Rhodococcus aetherivorans]|nr:hypothetical protein EBESD8_15850 [Rhodococcus aetherivorans]